MGNLVTKLTTNNIELNESDVTVAEFVRTPEVSYKTKDQPRTGLFKNIWNCDPRSPSLFLRRTPLFRNNSASKFTHQELNETNTSIESQVDLNILTVEEQDSLDLNKDLTSNATGEDSGKVIDPRSPTTEITRTPIIINVPLKETKKSRNKKEDNLIRKLTDKLVSTSIANDDLDKTDDKPSVIKPSAKKTQNNKNLIYEDDENMTGYSTPPKKTPFRLKDSSARTPLGCVANSQTPTSTNHFISAASTPKSKFSSNNENHHKSRIPVSARRLH